MRKKPNYLKREQRNLPITGYTPVKEEKVVIENGTLVKKEQYKLDKNGRVIKEPIFDNRKTMRRNLENVINSLGVEKAMSNSEFYLQPRINTALNKQVFINYVAEQLKGSDLKIYFDAYSDNITITDEKTYEEETNKFHKMISGNDFNIGINLHSSASNYSIKENFIKNETIKEKLREYNIYNCQLMDVVKSMYDTNVTCKVDYAYLFNTSIYNTKSKDNLAKNVNRNLIQETEEQTESLQLSLISEAYNRTFGNDIETNKEKNQFGVLDMISKLSGTSLNVCYERNYGRFTDATNVYLDLEFADPILVIKDDKDGSVLYKGEDILIAVKKTLDHFTDSYKFEEKDQSLANTLDKIFDSCYAQQQLIHLEDYMLTFETSTIEGEETLKTFENSINNAIQILQNYNHEIVENLNDEIIPYTKDLLKDYPDGITRLDIAYNFLDKLDEKIAELSLNTKTINNKQELMDSVMPSAMIKKQDSEMYTKIYNDSLKNKNDAIKTNQEEITIFETMAADVDAENSFEEYKKKEAPKRDSYFNNVDERDL